MLPQSRNLTVYFASDMPTLIHAKDGKKKMGPDTMVLSAYSHL